MELTELERVVLEAALVRAVQWLAHGGTITPVALFIDDANVHAMGLRFTSEEAKDEAAAVVRVTADKLSAKAVILVAEAWHSGRQPNEPYVKPEESDTRVDTLMVVFEGEKFEGLGVGVIESKDGARTLGPMQWTEGADAIRRGERRWQGLLAKWRDA